MLRPAWARSLRTRHGIIRIDAIAFDYGKVLSHAQDPAAIALLAGLTGLSVPEFRRRYEHDRLTYDRGVLTGTAYWERMLQSAGVRSTPGLIRDLIDVDVESWLVLDDRLVVWTDELGALGVPLAILSNMPPDVLAKLRTRHNSWLHRFVTTVFSCEVGTVKPEVEVYQRLIEELGVEAPRVLFIDDRQENTAAAIGCGLQAVHYTSFEGLMAEVASRFELQTSIETALERHQDGPL